MLYTPARSQTYLPSFRRWRSALVAGVVSVSAWGIATLPLEVAAFAAALGAGSLTLLRWPWLIWPAIALALPVASGIRLGPATATEGLLALAAGLWLMDGARRRHLRTYASPVLLLVLIYASVLLLSLLRAQGLGEGMAEVVKWAEFALVMALASAMVSRGRAMWLAAALVLAGVAQALLGLYQFTFQVGPEWFVLFDGYMRASGSFRQPNPYAGYLGVLLPIALSLAIWALSDILSRRTRTVASVARAAFFAVGFGVIAAGLLASWSRGGWMAAAASIVVVLAVRSRKGMVVTLVGGGAVAIALLIGMVSPRALPAGLEGRLQGVADITRPAQLLSQPVTDDNFALIERLAHWVAGYRMWESAPWLGVGAGNYAAAYESVRMPTWTEPLGHAHNLYLNILAETGLIGLAAFAAMWIGLAAWAWRRTNGDPAFACSGWCRAMAAAALGAMAYLTLHSMVDVLFVQGIYLALALILATLAAGCTASTAS